jgi:hypothetical protein
MSLASINAANVHCTLVARPGRCVRYLFSVSALILKCRIVESGMRFMPDWFLQGLPSAPAFAVLATITFLGGVMRGFSGFGAGLLMAPVFSLIMAPADMLVVMLMLNLLTVFQLLPGALRVVQWGLVMRIFLPALLGIPLGLTLVHGVDANLMRKTVAVVVVAVALLMLRGWYYDGRRGKLQDGIAAFISGTMTSIAAIGGPPLILYLLSDRSITPAVFRAVMIVYFFLTQIVTLLPLGVSGAFTVEQGVHTLVLLPVYVAANLVGTLLHNWLQNRYQNQARRVCLILLLLIGVMAFVV